MVDRIRKFQILNNQIFAILNKYLRPAQGGHDPLLTIKEIDPPEPDAEMKAKVKDLSYMEEGKGREEEKEQESLPGITYI